MNLSSFRLARPLAVMAMASALIASGVMVAEAAPSAASSAPRGVQPANTAIPLSHFLCYGAAAPNFPPPPTTVKLWNKINTASFVPKFAGVAIHCNPVTKRVSVGGVLKTYPMLNPRSHLLCWKISGPQPTTHLVAMANQFGTASLAIGAPNLFCVPSWKNRANFTPIKPVDPPNLDHFTCYPLTVNSSTKNFSPPAAVSVQDQFVTSFVNIKVGLANELCVPTLKVLSSGVSYPPYSSADKSLVCFATTKTPYWKNFYDQNQFGKAQIFATSPPENLCLPTVLRTLTPPPPTTPLDHFLCYSIATATGFKVPATVILKQALFNPTAFTAQTVSSFLHCNPVAKQIVNPAIGTKTYPINNAAAHLMCFKITHALVPRQPAVVVNQFTPAASKSVLHLGTAFALCAPTWKNRAAAPGQPTAQPPGLDHFLCYPVTQAINFVIPGQVNVSDEFSQPKFTNVQVNPNANIFCAPATKSLPGVSGAPGVFPPGSAADLSLTCFPVTPTPFWPSFFNQNQFGQGKVSITTSANRELCLPSTASLG
jgi:hypothetical protein